MQSYTVIVIVVILCTVLVTILSSLIGYISLQYNKRQIMYYNKMDQLKLEYEKNILDAQLEIQEATFLNIAQEIHDNVGLGLTLAKLNINTIDIKELSRSNHLLISSSDLISKALIDLSDLSKSINADVIANVGFISSIENEVSRLQRNFNVEIDFSVEGEVYHLDSKKEILLFRIFQESVNNVFKHSLATKITVSLSFAEDFVLTISDNGIGFDLNNVLETKPKSSGLRSLKKRASLIEGQLDIISGDEIGTTIIIKINSNTKYHVKK